MRVRMLGAVLALVAAAAAPAGGAAAGAPAGTAGRAVALTFDDGPVAGHTERVSRDLAALGVRATFFLVGQHVRAMPGTVRRILADGHEVGCHGDTHLVMTRLPDAGLGAELDRCAEALRAAGVPEVSLFRPPYGEVDARVTAAARERGMRTVMWDVDTLDWTRIPPEEIRRRAVEGLHAGAVVLMHGINARTPEAVPLIVEDARRLGYDLVPVGDLPPAAPARTARAGGR